MNVVYYRRNDLTNRQWTYTLHNKDWHQTTAWTHYLTHRSTILVITMMRKQQQ